MKIVAFGWRNNVFSLYVDMFFFRAFGNFCAKAIDGSHDCGPFFKMGCCFDLFLFLRCLPDKWCNP